MRIHIKEITKYIILFLKKIFAGIGSDYAYGNCHVVVITDVFYDGESNLHFYISHGNSDSNGAITINSDKKASDYINVTYNVKIANPR